MSARVRVLLGALAGVAMGCLALAAHAGDQGDPSQSCDGNTFEMVECLKAKTAQWDKRTTIAYQQALKDAVPQQREQLRAVRSGCGFSIATPIACITGSIFRLSGIRLAARKCS